MQLSPIHKTPCRGEGMQAWHPFSITGHPKHSFPRSRISTIAHSKQHRFTDDDINTAFSRRKAASLVGILSTSFAAVTSSITLPPGVGAVEEQPVDTTPITDKIFIEFGLCPEGVRSDRRLGDKSILCSDPEPLGRIVIGLYGTAAPGTVTNFKTLIESKSLEGTSLSKILPGQWIVAGTQGPKRSGLLQPPQIMKRNPDLLNASSFKLTHLRPGTLSLNLSQNEDDESIRFEAGYCPLSFLITTGPGPASSLDDENIVFGRVLHGMDVIAAITAVPTFQPVGSGKAYNEFARFIGDERASKTSAKWGKPLKAVLITSTGLVSD